MAPNPNVHAPTPGDAARATTAAAPFNQFFRLIAGQTAMLFAGFATAQGCAFLRNAIFANVLSRGDFGVAALILTLQMIETLAELGADKLIVQADDGASDAVVGTAQCFQLIRGVATGVLLIALAIPMAEFYGIPDAAPAFMAIALAPLMRGFINLDIRRAQRALNNRPYIVVEVLPQILALIATPIALMYSPTFAAVVIVAVVQSGATLLVSHLMSSRPMRTAWDVSVAWRMLAFAWPIWASALPLIAVYHGDRVLIGRLIDMEAVAGYSAAFLITMVPGLIAAKVGNAMLLPLLSSVKADRAQFRTRLRAMIVVVSAVAALYVIGFALLGGPLLAFAFGPEYEGLGLVVLLLAVSWGLRMLQVVPGMALMAIGRTQTLFTAGCIRALGLVGVFAVISGGYGIAGVAGVAAIAELASLAFVSYRTRRLTAA
ncbi:MAG: oligosaccharide flippase family protein [Pseudomonadota bacterium]